MIRIIIIHVSKLGTIAAGQPTVAATKTASALAVKVARPAAYGSDAFQDFGRLLKLRNWIVHLKSDTRAEAERETEVVGKRVELVSSPGGTMLPWIEPRSRTSRG
jgi:hypothetical protein